MAFLYSRQYLRVMLDEHKLAAAAAAWWTDIVFRTVEGEYVYTKVHFEVSMFTNNTHRYYILFIFF